MRAVEAYVGRIPDPVTNLPRQHLRPEKFALSDRGGAKCDRLEPRDASVSRWEIAPTRVQGTHDQIDRNAAGIEGQESLDLPPLGLFRTTDRGLVAVLMQRVSRTLESLRIPHLEANAVPGSGVRREHQRVIAKV